MIFKDSNKNFWCVGEEKLQKMKVFVLPCLSAGTESRKTNRMFTQIDSIESFARTS